MEPNQSGSTGKKRISIDELTVGMYLEDITTDRGVLLHANNTIIRSEAQIETLRQRGISQVTINIHKGADVSNSASGTRQTATSHNEGQQVQDDAREAAYYQELSRARTIHEQTMESTTEMLKNIRAGASFSISNMHETAENIAKSVLRNPDALVSLTQIKGFDEYTYTHSVNVGILVTSLAADMGYKGEAVADICMGGLLHDIGKMRIPESILNKPGKLTDSEFAVIKRHPELGLELITEKPGIPDVVKKMISQHHERFNGSGYPLGLAGKRIQEVALIAAVADVFDALTSQRVYKEAWTPQRTLALIFSGCDVDYSREIAEKFTRHMGIYPVGSFVRLASGEMGVVVRVDRGHLLAPKIIVIIDKDGQRLKTPIEYDLKNKQAGPEGQQFRIETSLDPKPHGIIVAEYL